MGFKRLSRNSLRRQQQPQTMPVNPSTVNTSPRSCSVATPRGTLRRKHSQDEQQGTQQNFVYEMDHHRGRKVELSTDIKPSVDIRAKHYPGQKADRPDLDSFLSYMYYSFIDPCCGDLERVLYSGGRGGSLTREEEDDDETMIFFGNDLYPTNDFDIDDDDDDASFEDEDENGVDSSFEYSRSHVSSFGGARNRSFASFMFSDTMVEI